LVNHHAPPHFFIVNQQREQGAVGGFEKFGRWFVEVLAQGTQDLSRG
jgi:hypothetical protein